MSLAVWLACYLTPFNVYTLPQLPEAYLLLFGYLGAFAAGTLLWRQKPGSLLGVRQGSVSAQRTSFTLLLMVAFIGLALRFFDLYAVRDFGAHESAAEFRLAELDEGPRAPGLLSSLSVLLYPVGVVVYVLSLYWHERLHMWQRAAAFFGLLAFGGYFVLQGGRTLIVTAGIMVVASLLLRGAIDPTRRFTRGTLALFSAAVGLGVVAFFGYSAFVLTSRLKAMGVENPVDFLSTVEDYRGSELREPYRSRVTSGGELESTAIVTASSLAYYINHGFFDFSELYESEHRKPPLGGVMQFNPVVRILSNLGVDTPPIDEPLSRLPRPGLFYTFFGTILIDYGAVGGLLYCFLFGAMVKAIWLRALSGSVPALLLYPFFVSVIFHFPMLDMISGGYGLFIVSAVLLSVFVMHFCEQMQRKKSRRLALLPA